MEIMTIAIYWEQIRLNHDNSTFKFKHVDSCQVFYWVSERSADKDTLQLVASRLYFRLHRCKRQIGGTGFQEVG